MVSGRDRRKETGDELASLPSSSSHVSEEEMPILAKTNCYTCARPSPPPHHTHTPTALRISCLQLAFSLSFTTEASPPRQRFT